MAGWVNLFVNMLVNILHSAGTHNLIKFNCTSVTADALEISLSSNS